MSWPGFADRRDAGRRLGRLLDRYRNAPGLIVLGLPRGGIPVAYEVARHLSAPLAPVVTRHEERERRRREALFGTSHPLPLRGGGPGRSGRAMSTENVPEAYPMGLQRAAEEERCRRS